MNHNQKRILSLAIPATIENILQTSVGFIDGIIIAKIGLNAMSAVGVVNGILSVYQAIFIAIGISATSITARFLGAKEQENAKMSTITSLVFALGTGIVFGVFSFIFSSGILSWSGAKGEVLSLAHPFFIWVGGACVSWSVMTVLGALLRATGDGKTPMFVSLLVNVLNVLLDFFLVFGWGVFPKLGITGAGIGTTCARIIGCLCLFAALQKTELAVSINKGRKPTRLLPFLQMVLPNAIERFAMRIGDVLINRILVTISTVLFASVTIFENIASFTFAPALGVASACVALVGKEIGAKQKDTAKALRHECNRVSLVFMIFTGVLLLLLGKPVATLFTNDADALKMLGNSLLPYALGLPLLAFSLVDAAAIQATGDTKKPMTVTILGMLCLRLPLVFIFCNLMQWNLVGVAIATFADNLLRSILLGHFWKIKLKGNLYDL